MEELAVSVFFLSVGLTFLVYPMIGLMQFRLWSLCMAGLLICGCITVSDAPAHFQASPKNPTQGTLATVHILATEAGFETYRRGGNAVDAAVAAALTLGVVDSHNSGIGGGCFMLVHLADSTVLAIDGRETAPARAVSDMYVRDGQVDTNLSRTGALSIGVPGSLAAYDKALRLGGRLRLEELLLPAAVLAENGFPIDANFAERLKNVSKDLGRFRASRNIFLDAEGRPLPRGHVLKQHDLARTYRNIAHNGTGYFYGGPFAKVLEEWMKGNGGILTAQDFADYRIKLRKPVVTTYRDYTIIGFPPPSSGGVHVAQILNILENFDMKELNRERPVQYHHLIAEAMKPAFADRAYWLGDPDFVHVPSGLVDKEYAKRLSARINLSKPTKVPSYDTPARAEEDWFGKHTTHIAAADEFGNWVAITTTLNTSFGSKVVIPGTGVVMNNQMDDFSAQPGVPNIFGLIGAEANRIEPGKRPLSSMSPTIILKDKKPILTLGAAGGPTIISQVLQVIVSYLDLGMNLPEAVSAPRIHHQWSPDFLRVEKGMDQEILEQLTAMGHRVKIVDRIGATQAVGITRGGTLVSVTDPRVSP